MRVLWIEDSPEIQDLKKDFFGSSIYSLHEVEAITDYESYEGYLFDQAHDTITNELERFDYIVIDINLKHSEIKKGGAAEEISRRYRLGKNEFLQKAGFDLFIQLMEKGFPKERIIFFSANTGSALGELGVLIDEVIFAVEEKNEKLFNLAVKALHNKLGEDDQKKLDKSLKDGDLDIFLIDKKDSLTGSNIKNTFEDIEAQFRSSRIEIPNRAISKNNPERLEKWFNTRLNFNDSENKEQNINYSKNYLTLRRGILNVLENIEKNNIELSEKFRDQIDKSAFVEGMRWLLQSHKLEPNQAGKFYLTLCDYMTKPFDSIKYQELIKYPIYDDKKFRDRQSQIKKWIEDRSIMMPPKFMRNWIAHGLITGSDKTPDFKVYDAGFTFLLVIKCLFDREMTGHKGELKKLFGDINISSKAIRGQLVKFHKNIYATSYISDKLDVIERLGQKGKYFSSPKDKFYWKKQNFLFHFYASCLLASTNLLKNSSEENNRSSDEQYTVNLTYELQQTPFINIAFQRLQELKE